MILGRKSTLFLVYAYQFQGGGQGSAFLLHDEEGKAAQQNWKQRRIEGAALLPHLDDYVKKGELLRAYDVADDLRGAFGAKEPWTLTDADGNAVRVVVTEPPRLYTFDTRYAFMVLGVSPAATGA